jgi:hypothetical protein
MDESGKKLIVRFCQLEAIKSSILNMMQIFLRFQDYEGNKGQEPDSKTLLSWFLNFLNNEMTQAASYAQNRNLIEAQNLIAEVIQNFSTNDSITDYEQIMDLFRSIITKITSEASQVADELQF